MQSNIERLASELGQLSLSACAARRDELLAAVRAEGHAVDDGTPTVVLLRIAGTARRSDVVDDLDAVAAGITGEAATGAEQRRRVLPLGTAFEAPLPDLVDVGNGDRHVRVGMG